MALKIPIQTNYGIAVPDAYARIENITGTKENINFSLSYYVSESAVSNNKEPVCVNFYSFAPSVEETAYNYHKQGYEHLKTLPDFATAIDC